MANRILPRALLLFACDDAVRRESDRKWVLYNPWSVVALPSGARFPFDLQEMWLYAQLTEGVGEFELHVEMRLVELDGGRKLIHRGKPIRLEFPTGNQLHVLDAVFHLTKIPFDEAGLYEFQVWAPHVVLEGPTALIRVLDSGDKL
jgi:hypothetical protein